MYGLKMWYAVSVKYTLEFEDLVWKKREPLIANVHVVYMLQWLYFWYIGLNKILNFKMNHF